jgi:hypothetical protein
MGVEYTLRFAHPDGASVSAVLRRLPVAHELSPSGSEFELRAGRTAGAIPDATVRVEPYGLYFCDYGGAGREFLGLIVTRLVSQFGAVTVAELE